MYVHIWLNLNSLSEERYPRDGYGQVPCDVAPCSEKRKEIKDFYLSIHTDFDFDRKLILEDDSDDSNSSKD